VTTTLDVPLVRGDTDEGVTAQLTNAIPIEIATRADLSWTEYFAALRAERAARNEPPPSKEHQHWEWAWKMKETSHLLAYSGYRVEFGGDVQGLMLLRTGDKFARLQGQELKPLVYVVYVQTAPWNNRKLVGEARYRGVGTTLLRAAIELSRELEFKGRIGLHSLPQAESWYDRLDIHCMGPDNTKGGLKYYEMTPEQAEAFVRED
jgi:hypothetical protein